MIINTNLKKVSGIYKISCNQYSYIGSSKNIYERLLCHRSHLRGNKHHSRFLQRCYNKYGESNITIDIIEVCENDINLLRERELFYIDFYQSKCNSINPITYEFSSEMKDKISKTLKEKYKNKLIINGRLGKGYSLTVYDYVGNVVYKNINSPQLTEIFNFSNRSVINNSLRKGRCIINNHIVIINSFKEYNEYIKSSKGLGINIYKIDKNGIISLVKYNKGRFQKKILKSLGYIYYSNKMDSYYTFTGNINKCPYYK